MDDLRRLRAWLDRRLRGMFCALAALAGCLALAAGAAGATTQRAPTKASELFTTTRVWNIHLKFTPERWAGLEPKQSEFRPFLAPRGPGGPGGPAMLLAPGFFKEGDQNRDGRLSREEFAALAGKWFAAWDAPKSGRLNAEQLRSGLRATMTLPPEPPRRGPGMVLQGAEGRRNGLAAAMGIEFPDVRAEMEFEGQRFKEVSVRYKGNGTWMTSRNTLKQSFKIDLNDTVKGQDLAGVKKLNLHSCITDPSWMNEVLSHQLFRDAGVPAPRSAYARVFVSVPGKYDRRYLGLYSIIENIDKDFAKVHFGSKKGAILKPVTPNLFFDLGDDWARYKQTYDPKTELSEAQARRVIEFCRLLTHADDAEFAARLGDYLDLEEFSRFMAVTVWLSTLDSILAIGQNYYVHLDAKSNKFQFMPWDLDHSFGQFPLIGSQSQRENLSIHQPWRGENWFLERVFKVEAFKKLYLARLDEFNQSIFKPERFHKQVDEVAEAIRPAIKEESTRKLGQFEATVNAGNPDASRAQEQQPGLVGRALRSLFGGSHGPQSIKGFVSARAQSVVDQVAGKSSGEVLAANGFGPRGERPSRRPEGPRRMEGAEAISGAVFAALDANRDGQIPREEFLAGFAKWFEAWNADQSGLLTEEQLRAGINRDLAGPPRLFNRPPPPEQRR